MSWLLPDERLDELLGWDEDVYGDYPEWIEDSRPYIQAVAKAQHLATMRGLVEWLEDFCHGHYSLAEITDGKVLGWKHFDVKEPRRKCDYCWQELKKGVE